MNSHHSLTMMVIAWRPSIINPRAREFLMPALKFLNNRSVFPKYEPELEKFRQMTISPEHHQKLVVNQKCESELEHFDDIPGISPQNKF